ncbi:hypothetical protein V6307_25595 [Serratia marcescens]|uniref:hypothetical protein n=1 Tax=Serratia marcescens TaxID=615 RepID=UPI0036FF359A
MTSLKKCIIAALFIVPISGFCQGQPTYDVKADENAEKIQSLLTEQLIELKQLRVEVSSLKAEKTKNTCTKSDKG